MITLDLGDDLTVSRRNQPGPGERNLSSAPDAPRPITLDWPVESDLAVRAHRAAEAVVGHNLPIDLTLEKRIPPGGGLGGGSSNAAGVLLALRVLFPDSLNRRDVDHIAADLGSDVPFALHALDVASEHPLCLSAIVTQPDPDLIPATTNLRGVAFVLLLPPFGCPTGDVFAAFAAGQPDDLHITEADLLARAAAGVHADGSCFNHLTDAAAAVQPRLASITRAAADLLARPVHLTGSGATLFALARDLTAARELAARFNASGDPVFDDVVALPVRPADSQP